MAQYKQYGKYQMTLLKKLLIKENFIIAFMSIKPIYAEKIIAGIKKYEFRRAAIREKLSHMIIYSTSPVKKIIGIAEVEGVHSSSPTAIWERTKNAAGISRKLFRVYFKNKKIAYAIKIKEVIPFDKPISPKEIEKCFNVPQSFSYVNHLFYNKALRIGVRAEITSSDIIFIGGIHGVGKSTLCLKICKKHNIDYLSASRLIENYKKKHSIEIADRGKPVKDIDNNQTILINALHENIVTNNTYFLDGHFTLFDMKENIEAVPETIFRHVAPKAIIVLLDKPKSILSRLMKRDQQKYNVKLLSAMQKMELKIAKTIAKKLKIQVHEVPYDDIRHFEKIITDLI